MFQQQNSYHNLPFQYVVINNQIYPVQTSNKLPQGNPIYNPVPNGPSPQPYIQQQQPIQFCQPAFPPIQPNSTLNQSIDQQKAVEQYTHRVVCYVLTYLFFFIGCIGVQYGLYGSRTAASLWISSYVFLIVALVLFFVMKQYKFIWLLVIQYFFLTLSFILEISAFARAVQHPVLYNYQFEQEFSIYNDRRILFINDVNYEQDKGMCTYYVNPISDYCFPLQYAIMAYEVIGFICYIPVYYGLTRRIYSYFKFIRCSLTPQQIQPIEQNSMF